MAIIATFIVLILKFSEPIRVTIPANYTGWIYLFNEEPTGLEANYSWFIQRNYEVPSSGVILTKYSNKNEGIVISEGIYYRDTVNNKIQLKELPQFIPDKDYNNMKNQKIAYIFGYGSSMSKRNDEFGIEYIYSDVKYQSILVCTPSKLDTMYNTIFEPNSLLDSVIRERVKLMK